MDFRISINTGFTLVELVSTLTIASILLLAAAPGLQSFIERNRITASVNVFVSHLQLARSEALKRNRFIVLCPSRDGTSCISDYTQWAKGYIVFVDIDRNKLRENSEPLLKYYQGENDKVVIYTSSNYRRVVAYYPSGMAWGLNTTIRFCARTSDANNRAVIISNTGRPRLSKVMADGREIVCT
ncbi:MAG: GspH/FimT family pseudopilin [Pseudomonadota bacterium]|nr:GspH/FimT family pseudopilin [Pseudomonadota bacterium]